MHSTRNIRKAKGGGRTEEEEQRSLHKDVTVNSVVQREVRNPAEQRGMRTPGRGGVLPATERMGRTWLTRLAGVGNTWDLERWASAHVSGTIVCYVYSQLNHPCPQPDLVEHYHVGESH